MCFVSVDYIFRFKGLINNVDGNKSLLIFFYVLWVLISIKWLCLWACTLVVASSLLNKTHKVWKDSKEDNEEYSSAKVKKMWEQKSETKQKKGKSLGRNYLVSG